MERGLLVAWGGLWTALCCAVLRCGVWRADGHFGVDFFGLDLLGWYW
jgi:hypothetical protein